MISFFQSKFLNVLFKLSKKIIYLVIVLNSFGFESISLFTVPLLINITWCFKIQLQYFGD